MSDTSPSLHAALDLAVARDGDKTAVIDPGVGDLTYRQLGALTDALRDRLVHLGVQPGERVGICLHKSLDSIVSLFGILKAGAAYVPVDADAPAARCAYIFNDCLVRVIVCERRLEPALREHLAKLGAVPQLLVLDDAPEGGRLAALLRAEQRRDPAP